MRPTNRRHTRALQRQRRNQGPEMLSRVADNKVKENALELCDALFKASTEKLDSVAATLLVELAESAGSPEQNRVLPSLAEQWAKEPPVVSLEIVRDELGVPRKQLQLTDGSAEAEYCAE